MNDLKSETMQKYSFTIKLDITQQDSQLLLLRSHNYKHVPYIRNVEIQNQNCWKEMKKKTDAGFDILKTARDWFYYV